MVERENRSEDYVDWCANSRKLGYIILVVSRTIRYYSRHIVVYGGGESRVRYLLLRVYVALNIVHCNYPMRWPQ